ncbi:MAG TPA: hypothetical protein VHP30_11085 [Ignavibacteriales bacterium]|nr:hypothetical protein [Ignavibacteriales bacterium]
MKDNQFTDSAINIDEIKELTIDFAENLLSIINSEYADSLILGAENSDAKNYVDILQLFEDVAEIISSEAEVEKINDISVKVSLKIIYISDEMERKSRRIKYKLFFEKNVLGGYEIVSTRKL